MASSRNILRKFVVWFLIFAMVFSAFITLVYLVFADEGGERIVIDKSLHVIVHYDDEGEVEHCFPISCGAFSTQSEEGNFRIYSHRVDPRWFLARWLEEDPEAEAYKPYRIDPINPLGTRFMGFNADYGIHGTNEPMVIGRHVSHGCIRMQITDVEELFPTVEIGTPVEVRLDPAIAWRQSNSFSTWWGLHNILNLARRTRVHKEGELQ